MKCSISCSLIMMFLAACTSLDTRTVVWDEDLPDKEIFLTAYHADRINQGLQTDSDYLTWIRQFYHGRGFTIRGWNSVSREILELIEQEQKHIASQQLSLLGERIASEWAKDNSIRHISTGMILTWSDVMYAAADTDKHIATINMIEEDINALLNENIDPSLINLERYNDSLQLDMEMPDCDLLFECP